MQLKEAARAAEIPAIWISPEQASFMQILLAAAGAREVVEVGTLAGYSAIAMARALPRERPRAHDRARAEARRLRRALDRALRRRRPRRGPARRAAPTCCARFADRSADAAFLDADKASYPIYLEQCLRIVRPGGLILVDNAFAFGQLFEPAPRDREVEAVRAFNDFMAAARRATTA